MIILAKLYLSPYTLKDLLSIELSLSRQEKSQPFPIQWIKTQTQKSEKYARLHHRILHVLIQSSVVSQCIFPNRERREDAIKWMIENVMTRLIEIDQKYLRR